MYIYFYDTIIGRIGITENNGSITNLYFANDVITETLKEQETPLLLIAAEQLEKYFSGNLAQFTLPLSPSGTPFMKKVWTALVGVPYGQTASYKAIASQIGNEKASRAVGMANNRNPIPIFIPCHRIIGSNGNLTGYRGGLAVKKILLDIES